MAQPVHVQYIPWTWSLMHSKTRTLQHSQLTNCTHSFKRVSKFTERSLMLLGHLCLNLLIEYILLFHNKKPLNKHQKNKGTLLLAVQCSLFSGLVPIDCSRRTHFSCCATLQHRNQKARGWIAVHQRLYHDDYLLYIQWIPAVPGTIRFVCAVWPQHSQRLPWNQEGVYKIETRLWLWSIVKGSFGFIDDAVVILAIL